MNLSSDRLLREKLPAIKADPDALLTRTQAAAYLGMSPATLATWACTHRQDIPYIKLGRSVRYRRQDLDDFLLRNTHRINPAELMGSSVFDWAQRGVQQ